MKVCIFGAGAIGGVIAARLAKGGAEVSVLARGAILEAIRAKGLTMHAPDGTLRCRPRAAADPAELGPQDYVIVTTKAPSLPSVAATIAPLLGPETPVAFVMNGIPWWYRARTPREGEILPELDPGNAVRTAIGVRRTIGGVVYSASEVLEPGVVHVETADGRVILGELDGSLTPRVERLGAAIAAGGLPAPVVPDIRKAVWTKLMGNLVSGPLCILGRAGMADVLGSTSVRGLAVEMMREVTAIAASEGIEIPGDAPEARIERSAKLAHKPSILQDLEAGKMMEVATMFRAPLHIARSNGVAVPNLTRIVALATRAAISAGLYALPEGAEA
ncbi:2-dehydropantoate 2-reductase [Siccirubricoccus sp. KC 17139]|uniref:2-dehydropantoate 2-reductase n=1 Tax=Siccirubricoccus soli TaxID=2899147 RepID=A0ABT1D8Q0_9PROT|nr:2-dehydropantoate 2-reductase [Siccirubricoccus soli]MCO6418293.1 2-dehydropantoate 2-reductase [Siccirubricoccus soli]MCP2684428.1 2-dehydropantoate 2-reductase [Siccirubricoccus soli]